MTWRDPLPAQLRRDGGLSRSRGRRPALAGFRRGSTDSCRHRWHRLHQRQQLLDVVAVASRSGSRQEGPRRRRRGDGAWSPGGLCRPGSGPSWSPLFRMDLAGVDDRPRPLDLTGRPQPREQEPVQPLPDPGLAATHPGAASRSPRSRSQALAADASRGSRCAAQTGSPAAHSPVGQPLSTRIAKAPLPPRKQRLDQLPQLVGDDPRRGGHRHPLPA